MQAAVLPAMRPPAWDRTSSVRQAGIAEPALARAKHEFLGGMERNSGLPATRVRFLHPTDK